jgi:hypothetical protein
MQLSRSDLCEQEYLFEINYRYIKSENLYMAVFSQIYLSLVSLFSTYFSHFTQYVYLF